MSGELANALTIVVPSAERPHLLARCVDYYAALPCRVVVVDGSREPLGRAVVPANVRYEHMPGADPWQRMDAALARVDTPFCVGSADDDFLLPDALESCVRALTGRTDCLSAQGIYCEYRIVDRARIDVGLKYIPSYRHHLLAGDAPRAPVARVESLMHRFVQCVWAVHRTEHLARIFRLARGEPEVPLLMVELLFGLVTALRGASLLLPQVYCLRDVAPSRYPARDKAHAHVLTRDPDKRARYRAFLDTVAGAAELDIAQVREQSAIAPHAGSVPGWLDAVLRRWALRVSAPDPEPVPAPRRVSFRDAQGDLHGEFELPELLGDVDTGPDALYPALRLVQRDFRPEDRFHVRFGLPANPARAGIVRAVARRLGYSQ